MHKTIPIFFLLLLSCFLLFGCTGKSVAINDTKVITIVDVNGFTHNITLGDLNDVSVSGVINGQALVYELATNSWVPGEVSATDRFVKVSATDTITNYLESKLAAGTNINIAKLNAGANEQLSISAVDTNCDINGSCIFIVYAQDDVNRLSNYVRYNGGLNIPTQVGNNGKFLQTNGTNVSWVTALTGVSWGIITGDWNDQIDLRNALNARANKGDVNLWANQLDYIKQIDYNNWYLLKNDANAFYAFKTDVNLWAGQLDYIKQIDYNNWYLLKTDANSFYAFKTDVNLWGDQRYYPITGGTLYGNMNTGEYNIDTNWIYSNVIWSDRNRGYGTMYCIDGNIVIGYLIGYSC